MLVRNLRKTNHSGGFPDLFFFWFYYPHNNVCLKFEIFPGFDHIKKMVSISFLFVIIEMKLVASTKLPNKSVLKLFMNKNPIFITNFYDRVNIYVMFVYSDCNMFIRLRLFFGFFQQQQKNEIKFVSEKTLILIWFLIFYPPP